MNDARPMTGDFNTADGLLWKAVKGELPSMGAFAISPADRLGPLVEIVFAKHHAPEQYAAVTLPPPVQGTVAMALQSGAISGQNMAETLGAFPMVRRTDASGEDAWDQWCLRFRLAAQNSGFPKPFADGLAGALGELEDNVRVHSEREHTGVVAFLSSPGQFEFVVADLGVGVLASLKRNPEHHALAHAGEALRAIVIDHATRFGKESGHGTGVKELLQRIIGYEGEVRFRSGDHALIYSGSRLSQQGRLEVGQKAALPGITISVLCRTTGDAAPRAR